MNYAPNAVAMRALTPLRSCQTCPLVWHAMASDGTESAPQPRGAPHRTAWLGLPIPAPRQKQIRRVSDRHEHAMARRSAHAVRGWL
eukprot:365747-Chlamydomonas_euryale.AAC.32